MGHGVTAREAVGGTTGLKFGIKLWSTDASLLPDALALIENGEFQYVELTLVPGTDASPFAASGAQYVVHCASDRHGLNIGDPSRTTSNLELIAEAIRWADELGAVYIVVHPGWGSLSAAVELLDQLPDHRYLIENMPKVGIGGEEMVGHTPEQIAVLKGDRFGFCFDLNHALKAASALGTPTLDFLSGFVPLEPSLLHVADGRSANVLDEHLDIGEGDYDFDLLSGIILDSRARMLTLETGRRPATGLGDDVRNLAALRELMARHGPQGDVVRRSAGASIDSKDLGDGP